MALPLCPDPPGPNHNLAAPLSQGKVFIPVTTGTHFFPFKPQHPLSESQTTPGFAALPTKQVGRAPVLWGVKATLWPVPGSRSRQGRSHQCCQTKDGVIPQVLLEHTRP